jgi:hypothetical protein
MRFDGRGFRGLMQNTAMRSAACCLAVAVACALGPNAFAQKTLTLDQAVALAKQQNPRS